MRPTLLTGVPRVYEKLHARIMEKGQSRRRATERDLPLGGRRRHGARPRASSRDDRPALLGAAARRLPIASSSAKIRQNLGDRVRYLVSGSAPLPASIAEFFQGVGLPIIEGYGLTETSPILTVNPPAAPRVGTVGKAIPGVELRIADDGEILARGPNIMTGYYNKPEATADVLRDGWFHTGDIGTHRRARLPHDHRSQEGSARDVGRKKIAPQPIEGVLKRSPLVAEAVLLGDRRKFAAVLIVPEFAALERRLKELAAGRDARSRASDSGRRARALPGNRRRAEPGARAVRAHQEDCGPARGVQHRVGRADADAEGEEESGRAGADKDTIEALYAEP